MLKNNDFPVATHSYFKASNLHEEYLKFISSSDYIPNFDYPNRFNEKIILSRLSDVGLNSPERKSLECALAGSRLQTDVSQLENFRKANEALFGLPNELYAKAILSRMLESALATKNVYFDEIIEMIGVVPKPCVQLEPSKETFAKYKDFFNKYREVSTNHSHDTFSAIQQELAKSMLNDTDWTVESIDGHSAALTSHKTKKILIGKLYSPRTRLASERIAVHEVYGHALRGPQLSIAESEGFALVLEQLLSSRFKLRRSYRYLAASLGWGYFGQPMNFRQVYEVIWRVMIISSRYSEENAKKHAFNECYRVFRGGRPDLAGAIYLKDITYLQANIDVWNMLMFKDFSYNEFIDIIEGRLTILK